MRDAVYCNADAARPDSVGLGIRQNRENSRYAAAQIGLNIAKIDICIAGSPAKYHAVIRINTKIIQRCIAIGHGRTAWQNMLDHIVG